MSRYARPCSGHNRAGFAPDPGTPGTIGRIWPSRIRSPRCPGERCHDVLRHSPSEAITHPPSRGKAIPSGRLLDAETEGRKLVPVTREGLCDRLRAHDLDRAQTKREEGEAHREAMIVVALEHGRARPEE